MDENEAYVRKRLQNCDDCIIRPMLLGEAKKYAAWWFTLKLP